MTLSVCMIVRDGDPHLDRALASVRGLADQIVVVDTGSVDGSVATARRHGAEVHRFAWVDDFAAARNASLAPATGDWILQLDADHELVVAPGFDLKAFLAAARPVGFVIRETVERRGVVNHLDRLLLFRRFPGLRYEGVVHEHPAASVGDYAARTGAAPAIAPLPEVQVIHHGYEEEAEAKLTRNLRLLRRAVEAAPEDVHYRFKLLATLRARGEAAAYAEALESALPVAAAAAARGDVDLPVVGVVGFAAEDRPGADVDALVEAVGAAVGWADVRVTVPAARRRLAEGRPAEAAALLERCFDAGLAFSTGTAPTDLKAEAAALLVRAYLAADAPDRVVHLMRVLPPNAPALGLDLPDAFERLRDGDPDAFERFYAVMAEATGR